MTAEYTVDEGQTIGELARELLNVAEELGHDPSVIAWTHRPDTPGGGVFIVTSDEVAAKVLERRQQAAEAKAAADAKAADKAAADEGTAEGTAEAEGGDETSSEDGKPLTTAQKRRAAKQAKAAEETPAAQGDASTETPAEADAKQNAE